MGAYSSIKTTVKVVVTTEQRGDSSDQELLVSSTLLSSEAGARVSLCTTLHYSCLRVLSPEPSQPHCSLTLYLDPLPTIPLPAREAN